MSGFQMVGTSTPFENRTKSTIQNPDTSGFQIPTLHVFEEHDIRALNLENLCNELTSSRQNLKQNVTVFSGSAVGRGDVPSPDRSCRTFRILWSGGVSSSSRIRTGSFAEHRFSDWIRDQDSSLLARIQGLLARSLEDSTGKMDVISGSLLLYWILVIPIILAVVAKWSNVRCNSCQVLYGMC